MRRAAALGESPASPDIDERISRMSVKELKALISSASMDFSSCVEIDDLRKLARDAAMVSVASHRAEPWAAEDENDAFGQYLFQKEVDIDTPPRATVCGKVLAAGEFCYSCKSCSADDTCVMCISCFEDSDHSGHVVEFHRANGGFCDCGDPEAFPALKFCSRHGQARDDEDPSEVLPETLRNAAAKELSKCADLLLSALPAQTMQAFSRPYENDPHPGKDWVCLLHNDDVHTFEQVEQALKRAQPGISQTETSRATNGINDYDRCDVLKGVTIDDARAYASNIRSSTATDTLVVSIAAPSQLALERRSLATLEFLRALIKENSGMTRVLARVICESNSARVEHARITALKLDAFLARNIALHPAAIPADLSSSLEWEPLLPLATLIKCTFFLPKPIAVFLYDLFLKMGAVDELFRFEFGHAFCASLPFLQVAHAHGFGTKDCILDIYIQYMTVKRVAVKLDERFPHLGRNLLMRAAADSCEKFLSQLTRPTTTSSPLEVLRIYHAHEALGRERYLYALNVFVSCLQVSPVCVYSPSETATLDTLLRILSYSQRLQEEKRHQGRLHVLYDTPEHVWAPAFYFAANLSTLMRSAAASFEGCADSESPPHVLRDLSLRICVSGASSAQGTLALGTRMPSFFLPLERFLAAYAQRLRLPNATMDFFSDVLQTVDLSHFASNTTALIGLRVQANSGLWRRNGESLQMKLELYDHQFRRIFYDMDIAFMQFVACVEPASGFFGRFLGIVGVRDWLLQAVRESPSVSEEMDGLTHNPEDLDGVCCSLVEECLCVLLSIGADLPLQPGFERALLLRHCIHSLAAFDGKCVKFSAIKSVLTKLSLPDPVQPNKSFEVSDQLIEDILSQVADHVESTTGSTGYRLKHAMWANVDPNFHALPHNVREAVFEQREKQLSAGVASARSFPLAPEPAGPVSVLFQRARIEAFGSDFVLRNVVRSVLIDAVKANSTLRSKGFVNSDGQVFAPWTEAEQLQSSKRSSNRLVTLAIQIVTMSVHCFRDSEPNRILELMTTSECTDVDTLEPNVGCSTLLELLVGLYLAAQHERTHKSEPLGTSTSSFPTQSHAGFTPSAVSSYAGLEWIYECFLWPRAQDACERLNAAYRRLNDWERAEPTTLDKSEKLKKKKAASAQQAAMERMRLAQLAASQHLNSMEVESDDEELSDESEGDHPLCVFCRDPQLDNSPLTYLSYYACGPMEFTQPIAERPSIAGGTSIRPPTNHSFEGEWVVQNGYSWYTHAASISVNESHQLRPQQPQVVNTSVEGEISSLKAASGAPQNDSSRNSASISSSRAAPPNRESTSRNGNPVSSRGVSEWSLAALDWDFREARKENDAFVLEEDDEDDDEYEDDDELDPTQGFQTLEEDELDVVESDDEDALNDDHEESEAEDDDEEGSEAEDDDEEGSEDDDDDEQQEGSEVEDSDEQEEQEESEVEDDDEQEGIEGEVTEGVQVEDEEVVEAPAEATAPAMQQPLQILPGDLAHLPTGVLQHLIQQLVLAQGLQGGAQAGLTTNLMNALTGRLQVSGEPRRPTPIRTPGSTYRGMTSKAMDAFLHFSFCSHAAHVSCVSNYLHSSMDDYTTSWDCPMCKSRVNALVPIARKLPKAGAMVSPTKTFQDATSNFSIHTFLGDVFAAIQLGTEERASSEIPSFSQLGLGRERLTFVRMHGYQAKTVASHDVLEVDHAFALVSSWSNTLALAVDSAVRNHKSSELDKRIAELYSLKAFFSSALHASFAPLAEMVRELLATGGVKLDASPLSASFGFNATLLAHRDRHGFRSVSSEVEFNPSVPWTAASSAPSSLASMLLPVSCDARDLRARSAAAPVATLAWSPVDHTLRVAETSFDASRLLFPGLSALAKIDEQSEDRPMVQVEKSLNSNKGAQLEFSVAALPGALLDMDPFEVMVLLVLLSGSATDASAAARLCAVAALLRSRAVSPITAAAQSEEAVRGGEESASASAPLGVWVRLADQALIRAGLQVRAVSSADSREDLKRFLLRAAGCMRVLRGVDAAPFLEALPDADDVEALWKSIGMKGGLFSGQGDEDIEAEAMAANLLLSPTSVVTATWLPAWRSCNGASPHPASRSSRRPPLDLASRFIELPKKFEQLHHLITTNAKCWSTMKQGNVGVPHPILCLLCGDVVCASSRCCADSRGVGGGMAHAWDCLLKGSGVFLRIRTSEIILVHGHFSTSYPSIYVDQQGEADPGIKRGGLLTLSESRYTELMELVVGGGIPNYVSRSSTGRTPVMNF